MRRLAYSCSALVLLTSLSFGAGNASASDGAVPRPALKPRIETSFRPGTERVIGLSEFWLPFMQDPVAGSVLYGDARFMADNKDASEFNLGLGYRHMVSDFPFLGDGIVGVHGWYDRRVTKRGSHFNQVTLGTEWYGDLMDVKLNGYIPLNDHKVYYDPNPAGVGGGFVGNQIVANTDQEVKEEALMGLDLELGFRMPFMDDYTDSTRIYGAGFYFSGDDAEDVAGWRTRLVSDVSPNLSVGGRFQRDDVRGSQAFFEVTLRLPFGNKRSYREHGLWARMDESPERDIDIVSNEIITDDGLNKPLVNSTTGTAQQIIHVDNTAAGGGDGTAGAPYNTLAAAEAAAGANDVIYVHRGDGTNTGMNAGVTLNDAGQKLIGAGVALTPEIIGLDIPDGFTGLTRSSALIAAGTAPVITNGGGDGVTISANDVRVSGVSINGATDDAIAIDGFDNAVISNVSIDTTTAEGIDIDDADNLTLTDVTLANTGNSAVLALYDDNQSYTATWSNVTARDNTANDMLVLEVQNTTQLNFTGTDLTVTNSANQGSRIAARNDSTMTINVDGYKDTGAANNGFLPTTLNNAKGYVTLNNATITQATTHSVNATSSQDSYLSLTVRNATIDQSGNVGINVSSTNDSTLDVNVSDSTIENSTFSGIAYGANNDSTLNGFMYNNVVNNSGSGALSSVSRQNSSMSTVVSGNTVSTTTTNHGVVTIAAHDSNMTNVLIEDNTVTGAAAYGIVVSTFTGTTSGYNQVTVKNNSVSQSGSSGIRVENNSGTGTIDNVLVDGNTIQTSTLDGLMLFAGAAGGGLNASAQNNVITNNTRYGVTILDQTAGAFNIDIGGGIYGSVGQNSIYSNGDDEVYVDLDNRELKAENNWWGAVTGLDTLNELTLLNGGDSIDAAPFLTSDPN